MERERPQYYLINWIYVWRYKIILTLVTRALLKAINLHCIIRRIIYKLHIRMYTFTE